MAGVNENCCATSRIIHEHNRPTKTRRRINFIRSVSRADLLVLSITPAIRRGQNCRNKGAQYRSEINKGDKGERNGEDDTRGTTEGRRRSRGRGVPAASEGRRVGREGEETSSKEDFRRLAAGIRNRLFGNNNSVHSAERRAAAEHYFRVGAISVSAFFRISRRTERATRQELGRAEREEEQGGSSDFSSARHHSGLVIAAIIAAFTIRTRDIMHAIACVPERRERPAFHNRRYIFRSDNGSTAFFLHLPFSR